jgi:hypothetical protein
MSHTVTGLIGQLQRNEQVSRAQAALNQRFFDQLVEYLRRRLGNYRGKDGAGPEDAANSALRIELQRLQQQGPDGLVHTRKSLWVLLKKIAWCKALNSLRDEQRHKRVAGSAVREADVGAGAADGVDLLSGVPAPDPAPDLAVEGRDYVCHLLEGLSDESSAIAAWLLQGHSYREILGKLGTRSMSYLAEHIKVIRAHIWNHLDPEYRQELTEELDWEDEA